MAGSETAAEAPRKGSVLTKHEARIAAALASAAIPPGEFLEGGGAVTVARLEAQLAPAGHAFRRSVKGLLWSAEAAAIAATGRPFSLLPRERATRLLESWQASSSHLRRSMLRAILTPIKAAHFDDPKMFNHVGCQHGSERPKVRVEEAARFLQQVTDGRKADEDLELECEVVVVGTGAGGAACAYELASRGRAVLMLEEGDYHRRGSFTSRASEMSRKLFRDQGLTIALGNVGIPIWAGRAVGGSTIINSGTCYRATDRVFKKWREEHGLAGFSAESMAPYYERVERMLRVERAKRELTGGVGRVIARGADKLGFEHSPIMRNAPDCDGQGVCCFGCPTAAKRSTDVSYVPEALVRGAQLVTAAKVEGIDVANGRATGVRGTLGSGKRFHVKAEVVVVSGGSLMSPVLLKSTGVLRETPALGKNLSIHPASKVMAVFDEIIDMANAIPQGYAVDELADEGIMFEGASTPIDVTALAIPWVGPRFMAVMEKFRHLATFGFLVEDTARGEVRPGLKGSPLITYNVNAYDLQRMQRALAILCDIFLAAGARRVMPMVAGLEEISSPADVARLRTMKMSPGDFEITAYHPLGTCRIGADPRTSVCGPSHETHEVGGLYVVDGSSVPTPLGVNPQMTIMALALRAAEGIDRRLS
jgi:choline dehydrogenase-like flavoprotein